MTTQTNTSYNTEWYPIPKGYASCPVCDSTGKVLLTEKELTYSWHKGQTHRQCTNCGGQTMSGRALGYTKIDPSTNTGCIHTTIGRNAGRCYTIYTCTKCSFSFDIDSGD